MDVGIETPVLTKHPRQHGIRRRFDRADRDLRTRLLVVQAGGRSVGLLVDACREFLNIPAASVQPPGDGLTGVGARYLTGIATLNGRLIVILNLNALLDSAEPILAA